MQWKLIDATYKLSKFEDGVAAHVEKFCNEVVKTAHEGIALPPLSVEIDGESRRYSSVNLDIHPKDRVATLTVKAPESLSATSLEEIHEEGADWWPLRVFREIEDALFHLRLNLLDVGCVVLKTEGSEAFVLAIDEQLDANQDDWFIKEVRHFIKRTLKRVDCTAKTFSSCSMTQTKPLA